MARRGAEEQELHPDGERRCGPSRQWSQTTLRRLFFSGFLIPTGRAEPVGSGTGLPVRFVWKPEDFKFQIKILVQSDRYTGPVRPGTSRLNKKIELVESFTCFQI
jgi:hypothetical protein